MRDFSSPSPEGSPSLTLSGHDCDLAEITNGFIRGGPLDISPPRSPGQTGSLSIYRTDPFLLEMSFPQHSNLPGNESIDQQHEIQPQVKSSRHRSSQHESTAGSNHASNWSFHDDTVLLNARARGQGWGQIQKDNFQNKTANACRKRHERLVAKRRGLEWSQDMLERLSTEYSQLREQIWQPLAQAVGEKWQDVEKACFEKGLKSLITPSRSQSRRDILHTQIKAGEISKSRSEGHPRRESVLPLKDILSSD